MSRLLQSRGVTLCLAAGALGFAQQTAKFDSTTTLILADVSVTGVSSGAPVLGLTAADFTLLDQGEPRILTVFDSQKLPLDVVFLLDTSGGGADRQKEIEVAKPNRAIVRGLRPEDRLAVATFEDKTIVHTELTDNEDAAASAIRGASHELTGRMSDAKVVDAVSAAARLFRGRRAESRRRAIFLVTHNREKPSENAVRSAATAVLEADASIVAVVVPLTRGSGLGGSIGAGVQIPGLPPIWREARSKATQTVLPEGGAADAVVDASDGEVIRTTSYDDEIAAAFERLRSRYLVRFYAPALQSEGEFHSLRIELTDEAKARVGDVRIHHRRGYVATSSPHP